MLKYFLAVLVSAFALTAPAYAQSTAANGAIEGTVSDTSGGVLPGVSVTITNADTGLERTVITNEHGERSCRPAAVAHVGSDDSGSEGHHHRLRARIRSDDGDGLQRGHAVGHEHVQGRGELSVPPEGVQRVPVFLQLRQHHADGEL